MNEVFPYDTAQKIIALYDDKCIYLYQAFGKEIAKEALQRQMLGEHFYLDRLSWVKPSFAWMLYRSHYATKPGQEYILRIGISHDNFKDILRVAIPTAQNSQLFSSGKEWRKKLRLSEKFDLTKSGEVMGTPNYMSPEQIRGKRSLIDQQADVYALGAILYELFAEKIMIEGDNILAVACRIQDHDFPSLSEVKPDLDKNLHIICHKSTHFKKSLRK